MDGGRHHTDPVQNFPAESSAVRRVDDERISLKLIGADPIAGHERMGGRQRNHQRPMLDHAMGQPLVAERGQEHHQSHVDAACQERIALQRRIQLLEAEGDGGRAAAETLMKNFKLGQIATHVADARTCVLHPANATHRQMNDAELAAAGVPADLVRLSVGLESREDLMADLAQALDGV